MGKFIDLTGQRFGRLVVIRRVPKSTSVRIKWFCQCDCGGSTIAFGNNLSRPGHTTSCGCRHDTIGLRHGHTLKGQSTPTYSSWEHMVGRCKNPNRNCAHRYIGRGITVCDRWMSFENFIEDMGLRPEGTTLDRIDNDGNYEPANCRWATHQEQCNNQSRNRIITIGGVSKTLSQWARYAGMHTNTLSRRVNNGWPEEDLLLPPDKNRRHHG